MIYLVDAFNVIYKFPSLEKAMHQGRLIEARRGLLELLFDVRSKWKKPMKLHLFFDGKKEKGNDIIREEYSGIRLYFSHELSADYLIKEYINRAPSPGEILVVSSDKDIRQHAKKHRCHSQTSEDFAKWARDCISAEPDDSPEKEANPHVSKTEVRMWEKLFRQKPRGRG